MIDRQLLLKNLSLDLIQRETTEGEIELRVADAARLMDTAYELPKATIHQISRWLQLQAVYKKAVPEDSSELERQSIEDFLVLERRLRSLNVERPWRDKAWYHRARLLLFRLLPPLNEVIGEVAQLCSFGSGATFAGRGPVGKHLLSKVGGTQTVTRSCIPLMGFVACGWYSHWYNTTLAQCETRVVPGNRIAFVPKDARKCRRIAVEPSLNMFLQQGIGRYLFRLLKKEGINLRDQSKNVRLAKEGSLNGNYATIDLSNASDTISYGLVEDLLPPEWFELLNLCRSPFGLMPDGSTHEYSSFSTQGNAYTFPLETLIFYAITKGCGLMSVYGDDIITTTRGFKKACASLEEAGFVVNHSKSFSTGLFRESCGGDFCSGIFIRPVYYRESATVDSDVATLHNLLVARWGEHTLPLTTAYLRGCVKDPITGPRRLILERGIDSFGPVGPYGPFSGSFMDLNRPVDLFNWWFWSSDQEEWTGKTVVRHQCLYWVGRRYGVFPRKLKHKSTNVAKYLTFLWGGSRSLMSSSMVRHGTAKAAFALDQVVTNPLPFWQVVANRDPQWARWN